MMKIYQIHNTSIFGGPSEKGGGIDARDLFINLLLLIIKPALVRFDYMNPL